MLTTTKEGRDLKVINDILYFYNAEDGHHYTKTYDKWICYPTNLDGTLDRDCLTYCDDLDFGVGDDDRTRVAEMVKSCEDFLEIYNRDLFTIIRQVRESTLEVNRS